MKNKKLIFLLITFVLLVLLVAVCLQANSLIFPQYGVADTSLFLKINGLHNSFFDPIMYALSSKFFWIPFYALIIYFLYRAYGKNIWQSLLMIALLIASADQLASHLIKNTVKRLRPSHVIELIPQIHLSKAGPGGLYGFVSSHAANSFALMVFLLLLLDKSYRPLKISLILWAILVSYSRMYNGVHYPLDVFVGGIIGSLLGIIYYQIHQLLFQKQ